MRNPPASNLAHDLFLPTLLFAALGGMTWAVRGSSGYGATAGCIFAGVAWGAAWWYIARDPSGEQSRRYTSGWIVLAVTVGLGLAGARGWMQWPSFFEGRLDTNSAKKEFVPIDTIYGFVWLFIAGVPWAGLGACMLAWCGSLRETRICGWVLRIACGIGGMMLGAYLFNRFPEHFLPLYSSIEDRYHDFETNPTLKRLINDNRLAIMHLGAYLGFLLYEALRRDWKNVVLITTVGLVNGIGWAFCQNWKWADDIWPAGQFNFWRSWESSGGISIGVAFGIAYFLVNRPMVEPERTAINSQRSRSRSNFELLLIFCGLTAIFDTYLWFHFGGWGRIYFCTVIIFALANSLKSSGVLASDAGSRRKVDWAVPLLGAAMLGGQFFQGRQAYRERILYYIAVIALGAIYCVIRRRRLDEKQSFLPQPRLGEDNLERFGLYVGVLTGLGLSIRNGLKGWFNIYKGDEEYWSAVLWRILGPVFFLCLVAIAVWMLVRKSPTKFGDDRFPHAYAMIWLVLIVLNILAQLITGPLTSWNEMAFSIYYVLLFFITAVIVTHYHYLKMWQSKPRS